MTFSFNPWRISVLPLIAASVKTLVVSWNEAAERNDSVSKDALVIPSNRGMATAGVLPDNKAISFFSVKVVMSTFEPVNISVSPPSTMSTLRVIWRMITSMCLSAILAPLD